MATKDKLVTLEDLDALKTYNDNEVDDLKSDLNAIAPVEYSSGEINKDSSSLTFTESKYANLSGYVDSQQFDSWSFVVGTNCSIYMQSIGTGNYMQLCVYPSGEFNDPNYVRYRNSDNNLPSQSNQLALTAGTMVIIITNKTNETWSFQLVGGIATKVLNQNIKLSNSQINQVKDATGYTLSYNNGVLNIDGSGLSCAFSDSDFNNNHGVFELQNLTYNNAVIFRSNNDYLGPVRVHGESIKGAKHGDEITDTIRIVADGEELLDGNTVFARTFTIYVESTIATDEIKRYAVWSFNDGKMTVSVVLKTLKDLQIDYIFGCGIISCQDDVNIAWFNKEMLTTDVLIGLNQNTEIVTTGGTLVSKRLSVNSAYGDQRVAFNVYSGRKKLYYYNCYGSNISVPSGSVFSSCTELEFV